MRTLDATTTTALGQPVTQPYILVEMGFSPAVYYSSYGQISWNAQTWIDAAVEWFSESVRVFNADTTFGQVVLAQGTAGRYIKVYRGDAGDSAHPNPELFFDGEMGQATIDNYVTIAVKRTAPARTPGHYAVPPTFNHVPPPGTQFVTPSGTVTLEGAF